MPEPAAKQDASPATPPRFTIIVPCYNEQDAVLDTIRHLRDSLEGAGVYQLLMINDGSTDRTGEILREAAAGDPTLRVIEHPTNLGYGAALKSGIRQARSELIVITDADGTYPNHRIGELVDLTHEQQADMVIGARTGDDVTYPLHRKLPKAFLIRYASWLARVKIPDMNSGLRVFRRDLALHFMNILPEGFSFTTTITVAMLQNHYQVRFVPISYHPRVGQSKIRPLRDTLNFIQLISRTGMYFAPLRLLAIPGFILLLAFLASFGYDVSRGDLGDTTVILLLFVMNITIFGLLADMIDKRTRD